MRQTWAPLRRRSPCSSRCSPPAAVLYNHFLSTLVLGDILADNAFLIIAAIGANFVILSGGIDLSIGSMIGFVGVVMANLDGARLASAGVGGADAGFGVGCSAACRASSSTSAKSSRSSSRWPGCSYCAARCFMVNLDSVPIRHPFVAYFAGASIDLPGGRFSGEFRAGDVVCAGGGDPDRPSHPFGVNVYAIGGDRASAALMGVPMRRTIVSRSTRSAGCTAPWRRDIRAIHLFGLSARGFTGNELNAIAAVVLGGTVLTGGVGMVAGTLLGGMILGLIATLINFNGSLNGAWIMITGGVLLFIFIVLQRSLVGSLKFRNAPGADASAPTAR